MITTTLGPGADKDVVWEEFGLPAERDEVPLT